ncbi:cardiotrophin-like cytokine factor 1 [Sorex araneus]|uniref:cardiotrophin-like cytokine factor 1 n=1 Tax=Sorex araneus TaxID=42254 RepID=UPI002433F52A|nr:cardiotrophin-like cytokine factor 1 [Sorex araneus]
MPSPPPGRPQEAQGGTAPPRLTSPPPRCSGRERSPRSPPFLLPRLPHPGEGRYNLWLQLYTSEKKKKVCRMSHTEKKNPKPSEKNLRVGLADGLIKAPRSAAAPLRPPPGEQPRGARGPMDLRAGDSWGVLACLCTVLWHLPAVPALNRTGDPGPGPSIQKTYDLTRYLEHQLRSLAGTYLNYLGPPFNEPDFNPPRLGAETLPRATVNLDVWRSLNDKLRLTQNYEAYSHLLCYLRGLTRQAATAELRRGLAHFCTSLQGLLGSIAGVMAALGYPLPQPRPGGESAWAPGPAHSDFLQKMDDFWLLKELQTWLWRSAKDFNRLKKKVPPPPSAAVTLPLPARGF